MLDGWMGQEPQCKIDVTETDGTQARPPLQIPLSSACIRMCHVKLVVQNVS